MENLTNDIRPNNDTVVFMCDLKDGDLFKIIGATAQRIYVYKTHTMTKVLVFKCANGNGEIKLPETAQFKLKIERV